MRCCVCLNEKDRLIFDGRCSEGFCVDCVPSLGAHCPNCRQQFAWVKESENEPETEVDENEDGGFEDVRCGYCREVYLLQPLNDITIYPNKPYAYNEKVCNLCFDILNFPAVTENSKVMYSASTFGHFRVGHDSLHLRYLRNDVLSELRLRFVHRLGVDYLDT